MWLCSRRSKLLGPSRIDKPCGPRGSIGHVFTVGILCDSHSQQAFLLLGPQHTQSQLSSTPTDPALSYCRHQSAGHQANQMSPKPNLALAAEAANPEARNLSPARNPQPSNPARTRGSKVETSDLRLGRLLPALWILTRRLRAGGGWTEFCTRSLGLARGGTIGNTSHLSRNAPLSSSPEKNIEVQASDSASIPSAEPCGTTKLFISVVNTLPS